MELPLELPLDADPVYYDPENPELEIVPLEPTTVFSLEERQALAEANLGLVRAMARSIWNKFSETFRRYGIEEEELMQEGCIGLLKALNRYDPTRGIALPNFASNRIRGQMLDYLRYSHPLSRSLSDELRSWEIAQDQMTQDLGHTPSLEDKLGFLDGDGEKFKKLQVLGAAVRSTISLDTPVIGEDPNKASLHDILPDPNALDPEVATLKKDMNMETWRLICSLKRDKERDVLFRYFFAGQTLNEIGEALGMTESNASLLKTAGLRRLNTRRFHEYLQ